VGLIFRNNAIRISESNLRFGEGNAVLGLIYEVPLRIPFKAFLAHWETLAKTWQNSHTFIWQ
jgi:hypothetical protein